MRFSIITACFNAGDKLTKTLLNILEQIFDDFEIIVKDGGSTDGCVERAKERDEIIQALENGKLQFIVKKDQNVYDGMNQALEYCQGEYVLFLNCGDTFYNQTVLKYVDEKIRLLKEKAFETNSLKIKSEETNLQETNLQETSSLETNHVIIYGNTFCEQTKVSVHSSPSITGFTCYRNIPCHQSCFYSRSLFMDRQYDISLGIRADYDHFLWCYYKAHAEFVYMDLLISAYEGGGISENKQNIIRDKEEHKIVIDRYMSKSEILRYKGIMLLTLAPIRRYMASNHWMSGFYHHVKSVLYR